MQPRVNGEQAMMVITRGREYYSQRRKGLYDRGGDDGVMNICQGNAKMSESLNAEHFVDLRALII
mgnify:CR=1 FL=1